MMKNQPKQKFSTNLGIFGAERYVPVPLVGVPDGDNFCGFTKNEIGFTLEYERTYLSIQTPDAQLMWKGIAPRLRVLGAMKHRMMVLAMNRIYLDREEVKVNAGDLFFDRQEVYKLLTRFAADILAVGGKCSVAITGKSQFADDEIFSPSNSP